ncbi:type VII secretion protein EccCa [Salininema proteolyticum]|uniref:Type VII secretion protein EccCa n=1 Tax=Salininema proteolyticum TaxID=1607685 RepID=A0ABV8U2E6_9ACTN
MTTKIFRRQKRKYGPQMPRGEIILESPPDMPEAQPKNLAQYLMVIPMVAGGLSMMLMMSRRGMRGGENNELMMIAGGLMGVSMMGMMITNIAGGRNNKKAEFDAERRDFMRYLSQVRRRARNGAEKQWRSTRWIMPDPKALWSLVGTRRMWERRRNDDDAWLSRVGVGKHRLSMKIVPPETKPVEDLEPMSSIALRRFVAAHSSVHDMPRALNITHAAIHVMRGNRDVIGANLRAQLCHLATMHSPDDLAIAVIASPERLPDWHWLKWLPHNQHPSEKDGAGETRLLFHGSDEAEKAMRDMLQGRPSWSPGASAPDDMPHVVFVVDDGDLDLGGAIGSGSLAGTTLFNFRGELPRKAGPRFKLVEYDTEVTTRQNNKTRKLGVPDQLSVGEAEGIARTMSKWRASSGGSVAAGGGDVDPAEMEESPLAKPTDFVHLMGFDPDEMDPRIHWKDKPIPEFMKIPIGPGADGAPVEIDFKEAAQNGMGPHGLLIGATGSGKSEVLRTFVGALAASHSSDELNFILVDFKGGATFASLDVMPHTSAVITNLADEVSLVDRMADAIEGELLRRMEVLRAAGNFTNRWEYEKARRNGADIDPMPALMIVADEFSEMLVAKPEFINVFLQIGRIGRSIGVHMLLASQRLEEGKLKGLDTFLSYRIALRTFSAAESRTVIGSGDAYELPQAPGHGYLQVATEGLVRFRAAYVGGDYKRQVTMTTSKAQRQEAVKHKVQRFLPGHVELPPEPEVEEVEEKEDPNAGQKILDEEGQPLSQLEVVVKHVQGQGRPAHKVWLPPFDKPPALNELLPPLEADPKRGLSAPNFPLNSKVTAVLGEEDRPREQKRVPFTVDFSGAGGSAAIIGGAQSGKSTMLRTLITSMSLLHTPEEVQFYCLDFGGGTLRGVKDLPHVAGVFGRRDVEGIRRTFQEVGMILNEREEYFSNAGIDGIGTFRRGKQQGKFQEDKRGDIFLVIDNWLTVRDDFDEFVDDVRSIGNRGLAYGIHVLVTASRWGDIRMNMRDMFGTKLELKLSDNMESEVDRKLQLNVPKNRPGRGLTLNKLHSMVAAPRIDGIQDADDLAPGIDDLVKRVKQAWPGKPCPQLRLLPRRMPPEEMYEVVDRKRPGIPIGINEAGLKPVYWDPSADPHMMIFGDAECGKTNLLRWVGKYIQDNYGPKEAKVLNIDLRRGMLEQITKPTLLDYVMSQDKLKKAIEGITPLIEKRLPGDDVTPQQLRDKSWWTGPELFVIINDFETTGAGRTNPLSKFADFIPQGADIGFHFVVARRMAGAGRSGSDPILGKMKDGESPVLVMSGKKEEGAVVGKLRPSPQPPGRGTWVTRREGEQLIHTPMMPEL